jgi:2,5-diketo-D-gluconate reductase A
MNDSLSANATVALHTGNTMPVIGLGTWQLKDGTAEVIVKALELGYRLIDTSGNYGTQPGVGEGLRRSPFDRNEIFICTKIEAHENSYDATVQNLQELQIDYADLMLIHWPPQAGAGLELWQGLIRAKQEGLVKDIGVSNYSVALMQTLIDETGEKPVVNQIEWSPFGYSEDMLKYCKDNNIVIQAYSPITRQDKLDNEVLVATAQKYSKTPAQILIRWNIQLGTVPLPKSSSPDHLAENISVFDFEIAEEDMVKLNGLNDGFSALGRLPYL